MRTDRRGGRDGDAAMSAEVFMLDLDGLPAALPDVMHHPDALSQVGSPYVSGRSRHWIKSKNPAAQRLNAKPRKIGANRNGDNS